MNQPSVSVSFAPSTSTPAVETTLPDYVCPFGKDDAVHVVTHSEVFHADEIMAIAVIKCLCAVEAITRTRDLEILRGRLSDPSVIVFDVGGEYDPAMHNYDHHQRSFVVLADGERKLASAGLAWKHFGMEVLRRFTCDRTQVEILEIWHRIDRMIMHPVDVVDNGQDRPGIEWSSVHISAILGGLNDMHGGWDKAIQIAWDLLRCSIVREAQFVAEATPIAQALHATPTTQAWAVMEWSHTLMRVAHRAPEHVLFVVFQGPAGDWKGQQIPDAPGSTSGRLSFPEAWRGRNPEELQALMPPTVPPGVVFTHPNGFIAGHQTREGMIAMVEAAIAASN